jgi:2-amino-4-hydroxy-6-hydroxymethyldihydropteridine diphosphokinase
MRDFDCILGLGSNVGDKVANIEAAIAHLTRSGQMRLVRRSRIYRTAPWGKTDQDWFANAVIAVATSLSPHEVLALCQKVETDLGRVRLERWGPRTIDVDVLVYRDLEIDDPDLIVPHPRIAERAFVLVPLAEIAPDLEIGGRPVTALLRGVEAGDVTPLDVTQ